MKNRGTFWIIWNPLRGIPKTKHSSFAEAKQEAERLASLHSDEAFIILESVLEVRMTMFQYIDLREGDR